MPSAALAIWSRRLQRLPLRRVAPSGRDLPRQPLGELDQSQLATLRRCEPHPGAGSAYAAQVVAYPSSLSGILVNPNTLAIDGSETYLNNACTDAKLFADQCTYLDRRLEIQPQTGNLNVLGRFTKNVGDGWQVIATGSLFRSEAEQVGLHSSINPDARRTWRSSPVGCRSSSTRRCFRSRCRPPIQVTPSGRPRCWSTTFRSSVRLPTQYVTNTYRLFGDLKGNAGRVGIVDATAGLMYAAVTEKSSAELNYVALQNALNNGYILGSPDGAALFAAIESKSRTPTRWRMSICARHARWPELPGGPLSLGAGVGFDHRFLDAPAPPTVANGAQFGSLAYAIGWTDQLRRLCRVGRAGVQTARTRRSRTLGSLQHVRGFSDSEVRRANMHPLSSSPSVAAMARAFAHPSRRKQEPPAA